MFYDPIIAEHIPWLNDRGRNLFYKNTIKETCKNKVCVDVGSGTGILTDYALESGAKKIYCVEIRKSRANHLREKYKNNNKVLVIENDFLNTNIGDAEVFFLEQIGCQFDNDFSFKKFMTHVGPEANIIPNRYLIKAYIYDGIIDEKPNVLVDSAVFPRGFYSDAQSMQKIKPVEVNDVYLLNQKNSRDDIKFTVDLTNYKHCTIFLDDEVYYNDTRCEYENVYREWQKKPYRFQIKDAKQKHTFIWDNKWQIEKL